MLLLRGPSAHAAQRKRIAPALSSPPDTGLNHSIPSLVTMHHQCAASASVTTPRTSALSRCGEVGVCCALCSVLCALCAVCCMGSTESAQFAPSSAVLALHSTAAARTQLLTITAPARTLKPHPITVQVSSMVQLKQGSVAA